MLTEKQGVLSRVEILRRMSPEKKLDATMRLYWSARQLKAAGVRAAHPSWTDAQVEDAVRDAFLFHRER